MTVCFPVHLLVQEQRVEELNGTRSTPSASPSVQLADLVIVRCGDEYDGALAGNVERAPRPNLAEEDIGDNAPEDKRSVIDEVGRLAAMYSLHADTASLEKS